MDVFQYLDPYLVMRMYYESRKKHERDFSYARWADELGIRSYSTLRMMVVGKKRLSLNVAEKFIQRALPIELEKNYFRLLLSYAHASTPTEKNAAWSALAKILASRIEQKEASDFLVYISDLLIPKIMTMLSFGDQIWTDEALTKVFNVNLSVISDALKKLMVSGMIVKEVQNGVVGYRANDKLILVSDRMGDLALRAYHDRCMDEAKDAQNVPVEKRRYKSLLLPLSEEELAQIHSEVQDFIKQLISKYQSDVYEGRRLYKLNLNYYPVSKALSEIKTDKSP